MLTDQELVLGAQSGEQAAFDELVRRHRDVVRRIACSFAAIREDADDLVQETFVTAYLRIGQLSDPSRFRSWLMTIARNQGRMWHRRRQVQPTLLSLDQQDELEPPYAARASVRQALESERRNSIREAVAEALISLSAMQRHAVELYYLQGYDYSETALLLSVPQAAVRGRLDRARGVLRRELKTMAATPANEWHLSKRDLDAFRAAAQVASPDSDNAALSALLITGAGQLVSTDLHRLLVYQSESLKDVPEALISADLGRELDLESAARKGILIIGAGEAVLKMAGREIRAPLVRGTFLNWTKVVPAEFTMRAKARCGDMLQALDLLSAERDNTASDGNARILVVMAPAENQITLLQGCEPVPKAGKLAKEVSVRLQAQFSAGDQDLVLAMNPAYLEQAIRLLHVPDEALVELSANNSHAPVMTRAANGGDVFIVTMPMQRVETTA